ncbi:Nif3-like dinuclear metal center hexameric protein, partial [Desulfuromonas sp. TF]|uniref:Nif3-like dinuclear metal center hexameric protein n=1 Tax=Desulfuromonas sp. TF TaxID=1232410 RepID=UPI0004803BDE
DLLGLVNTLYPPVLSEEWDNAGLQAGDPSAELKRVLVCLDPSEQALDTARETGAQALLTHHPLLFRPLRNLTPVDETGRILFRSIREGVAVLCAHTNLDKAAPGLNDWLAERLGLSDVSPLSAHRGGDLLKLVVFVPRGYEEVVADALFKGGAGQVGNYDRCSFAVAGTGTFRPGEGTDPFLGRQGETERVGEIRLETILPREAQTRVVEKMLKAHPYEEVAYDLIPLANGRPLVGLGRIGRLAQPSTLSEFAAGVKAALGGGPMRFVGDSARKVLKVAVCGGSGASLLNEAARRGADVLVTGDLKYHEARSAESRGMAVIDAGHFATEHIMIKGMAEALRREAERRGLNIEFIEMEGEEDPFKAV